MTNPEANHVSSPGEVRSGASSRSGTFQDGVQAEPRSPAAERPRNWGAALREFARLPPPAVDRCDLCGQAIAAAHAHLLEVARRRFACACEPCAARTERDPASAWRCLPVEVRPLADFRISDAEWEALGIPIGLAFFVRLQVRDRVMAMYPGAAGAVESLLDADAWQGLVAGNPILASLRPEVEALLVYRVGSARRYYLAPIDRCYALTGLMRTHWRGVAGGTAVREAIDGFFAELTSRGGVPGRDRRPA